MGREMPSVQADGPLTSLSANDRKVLAAMEDACTRFDGYMPHGASSWLGVRRLCKAGLIESIGFARCEDCSGDHEGDAFKRVGVTE